MKGKMRKGLSLLLCLLLCVGLFPTTASATSYGQFEYTVKGDGTAEITIYLGSATELTIPETLGEYTVTSIRSSAFRHCDSLTKVTIPSTVTSIGESAFYNCRSLTSVTIPKSVTSIGNSAFSNTGLTEINLPEGVTSIGDSAFDNCTSLTSVTIPKSVTSIGNSAFSNTGLIEIIIPEGVTSIGDSAFLNTGLTSVTIPSSVTSIGNYVFYYCTKLGEIQVHADNQNYVSDGGVLFDKDKTTLIQYPAGKTGDAYTIPSSVTDIGINAFNACGNLTSVTIPESVTSIGNYAFSGCDNLKTLTVSCTLDISNAGVPSSTTIVIDHKDKSLTKTEAKAPTCEQDGNVEYWTCFACNKNFSDSAGQTELTSTVDKALGHDWGEVTYTWADDGSTCTASRTCGNDQSHVETAKASITKQTVEPTCTEKGKIIYTATFTENWASRQSKEIENGNALGHDWGEVTYTWADDGSNCTASRTCGNDQSHVQTAKASITKQTVEPTCTDKGETTYTAEFTEDWAKTQTKTIADVDALGHDFSGNFDASDENGHWHICNRTDCNATDTAVAHSFTNYIYNNDATYFADGTETATCDAEGCGQTHTQTANDTKLTDDTAPTGVIKVKENSWKSFINTITFGIFCNDKFDVTIEGTDEGSGIESIEYLLSETAIAKADIEKQTGWQTYAAFSIENEGKYIVYAKISDKVGNVTYISSDGMVVDKTVPALSGIANGSTYCGAVEVTVSDDYMGTVTVNNQTVTVTDSKFTVSPANGTQTVVVTDKAGNSTTYTITVNDGHTFTNYVSNNDATCEQDGTKTAKCEYCTATDTKADEGSATGHDWGEVTYTWADDGSTCTASRTCGNDQSHVQTAKASITKQTVEPTCTEKGKIIYTATFTKNWAETQTKTIADVEASGHNLEKIDAKAATHTAEGNIEYWYCSVCEKYFRDENAETEITLADTVITKLAEHTADLTKWEKDETDHWNLCECGEKLNKAAHNFEWVTDKEATTTEKGEKHEECTVCGYKRASVEIPVISTYPPEVEKPDGGDVEVTPNDPQEGDKVTITPKPEDGYEVKDVTVTDEDGKEIPVTKNDDGTYSFTQPEGKVTITVDFAKKAEAGTEDETQNSTSPQTGDNSNMTLWIALLLVSATALMATVVYRRQKKETR